MDNLKDVYNYLKSRKWVDLSHNINKDIPHFNSDKPIREKIINTKEKDGFLVKEYTLYSAYATHFDAPTHFSNTHDKSIDQYDLKELIVPLYVLRFEDKVAKNPDYVVSIDDIMLYEQKYGHIEENSFVAFCSNWSKRWSNPQAYYNYDQQNQAHTPGWSLEAIKFLVEKRNICGIGHETLDTDASINVANNNFMAAQFEILNSNKYQIEQMTNLNQIPPTGAIMFATLLKIEDAPSFPIRVFAIIDEKE